jgi:hypothetical protein
MGLLCCRQFRRGGDDLADAAVGVHATNGTEGRVAHRFL